jgi:hypothetical protein
MRREEGRQASKTNREDTDQPTKLAGYLFFFLIGLRGPFFFSCGWDLCSAALGLCFVKGTLQTLHSMKSFGYSFQHFGQKGIVSSSL